MRSIILCCVCLIASAIDQTSSQSSPPPWRRFLGRFDGVRSDLGLPVYDRTFTYAMDGRFNLLNDRDLFIEHQSNVMRTEADAIARGKEAAANFKEKFGDECDFTNLEDEKYLSGTSTSPNGKFEFRPFMVDPAARLRVVAETKNSAENGHESKAYKNAIVSSGGWVVAILEDTTATGSLAGTPDEQLNKGDMSLFGDYNIQVWRDCPNRRYGWASDSLSRRCFFNRPRFLRPFQSFQSYQDSPEQPAINIMYRSRTLARAGNPLVIDCVLEHQEWGPGSAIGAIRIISVPDDGKGPIVSGSSLNKFPADPEDGGL